MLKNKRNKRAVFL